MKNAIIPLLLIGLGLLTIGFSTGLSVQTGDKVISPLDYEFLIDFENSDVKINPRGENILLNVSQDFTFEGNYSLKIENRKAGWEGPEIDFTNDWKIFDGTEFTVYAPVYQTSNSPQLFRIVACINDATGERFVNISEKVVVPNFWKEITGTFKFDLKEPVNNFSLIIITPLKADFTYYLDDFKVLGVNKVPRTDIILKSTFEKGIENWQSRGDPVSITSTDKIAHSGKYSLYVTERQSNWHGAQIDLKDMLIPGKSYEIEVWVYQETGQDQQVTLTMQRKYASDDQSHYDTIVWQRTIPSNKWTQIGGSYTVKSGETIKEMLFYVESPNNTLAFYLDDFVLIDKTIPLFEPEWEIPDLYEIYGDNFKIGVAVPYKVLSNPLEMKMVEKHFNSITAENEMKPESLLVDLNSYKFSVADEYISFAQSKNFDVRGHTLLWHNQTPDWFFKDTNGNLVSREVLLKRMEKYIKDVVGHFSGKIQAWDVVNEAIDPNQPDGLRRTLWYDIIGPEYIEYAFKFAHEADPNAKLFYNDYNTYEPKKRDFIYNLVSDFKARGIPIDGIGMQMHIGVGTDLRQVEEAIELFSSIPGIEIHITELDMSIYKDQSSNYDAPPYESLVEQGYVYKELFTLLKKYDDVITSVTFWGLKDDYSWKNQNRNDWPLLFDKDYQAKYSYWGIVEPTVLPILPKKSSIAQGTAIPFGMLDDSYLFSIPIQIFDEQGKERLNARVIWNENTLFIYGDVQDETKDPQDGIAIFIDPNNAKTPYLQDDDVWAIIRTDWTVETNKPDEIEINHFVSPGYKKYNFECSIILPQKFEKDSSIGFDIAIIDGNKIYSWSDTTNQQKEITANYGTLVLEAAAVGTAKYGTPIIDGEIDDIWKIAETYSTQTVVSGSLQNAKADFKVLWDEKALYVLATVSDPVLNKDHSDPWEQDSVEIFIDENNNKTGFYELDDAQYRVNFVNEQSFGTGASAVNFKTATKEIDGGYIIEAAISWKTIAPSGGEVIGFDVQVNDASASGRRAGILTWNDPTGNNYQSTVNFGNIKLEK
ncbi:endo-1,4-beta-xylanase [Defluviitoga tunisiensis]|jgi:endo-1,4-beta-xylanase|uniref:Beta-xylanase n=1 Tax=Defluviitoga tunisiensis TaxID=1006576 RepID=A0A0C7P426_DEFTU|nr:endo-1,4-beta-xylanase [Defluviitoga tunisiensis]CEP78624.1 cellulose 1,4-beta-cellobiosidase [Defluviitoga tunisiensis]